MKKVLIIGNNDAGLFLFRLELIVSLIDKGIEVHFTVPKGDKVSEIEKTGALYHNIEVDRRGMSPKKDFKLLMDYISLMKEVRPDLILTYTIKPNVYGGIAAAVRKIPYISTITGLGTSLQGGGGKAKLIALLYKIGLYKSRCVFFQNTANKEFFCSKHIIPIEKAKLVNGSGVNTEKYSPEKVVPTAHDGVNFLFIARIMRDKGVYEYILAARNIKADHPESHFQLLGFYDEESIKVEVENGVKAGFLEYLGFSKDTRIEMSKADCIVLPSYHEGMSNVLLEGAASGLPLVATDVPGCREAINDTETGFLCKAKDAKSLEDVMRKVLNLSKEERLLMGLKGRSKILKEFDRTFVVSSYIKEIDAILG